MGLTNAGDSIVAGNIQYFWVTGAVMLVVGALFGAGALFNVVTPVNAAYTIASLGLFLGLQNLTFNPLTERASAVPMWAGLAIAIAMIVGSIPLKRGVLLGFGAAGVVVYSVMLVNELFGGQIGGPIMLLIVGTVFVAMAVLVGFMLPRMKRGGEGGRHTPPLGPHMGAHA